MSMITAGLHAAARAAEEREGVSVTITGADDSRSTHFNEDILKAIREAIGSEGLPLRELWSGAGHDAGPAALHWPTGMIFVRSKDGLSHAEAEYSSPEDIAAATAVLLRTAVTLASTRSADR
jgi:acetylornithine deacetylase/succinyl-diaminopimelate desuccinylase-like protein